MRLQHMASWFLSLAAAEIDVFILHHLERWSVLSLFSGRCFAQWSICMFLEQTNDKILSFDAVASWDEMLRLCETQHEKKRPQRECQLSICIYIECVCWSISFGFQTESRFYWWTPDDSFIQLKPTQVLFPPNNAYEWSQSIYTTGAVAVPVVKLNSYDISSMSPTLAKLVENSELDLDAVNSMMLDKVQNSLTREQAACAWLKSNEDRWKATRLSRAQCRILELQTQVCYSLSVTRCYSHHNASPRRSPSWVSQCVSSTISRNCMHYWQ